MATDQDVNQTNGKVDRELGRWKEDRKDEGKIRCLLHMGS